MYTLTSPSIFANTAWLCVAPDSSSLHMDVNITSNPLLFKKLIVLPNVDLDIHISMVSTKSSNKYSTLNY